MSEKICFVEDDASIRELVSARLIKDGFQVDVFSDAESVLATNPAWDFYLLDVMLAGHKSGLELCEFIRQKDPIVPVLILSALSDPTDRVEGLKSGADDYLTKPFEMEELLLRIRGMLKRRSWYRELPNQESLFSWDNRTIDFVRFEGSNQGQKFRMGQKEIMLIKCLIEKEGQVVSRDEILNRVWGYDVFPSARTVDNFILRLRKFFEEEPSKPKYIHSVRGTGYRFTKKATS